MLRGVKLFETCTEDMLKAITEHLAPQFFLTGDVLFREGATGDTMFFIEKGVVKLQLRKQQRVLAHLRDGQYFGEMARMQCLH